MTYGQAIITAKSLNSPDPTADMAEKFEAIKKITEMATINAVNKADLMRCVKWLLERSEAAVAQLKENGECEDCRHCGDLEHCEENNSCFCCGNFDCDCYNCYCACNWEWNGGREDGRALKGEQNAEGTD